MNYWIICLPRTDMEHCIKIGKFGRNQKWVLGRVKAGDKLICMVTKEWKIIAAGEVTSDYYMDSDPCFLKDGLFPDRFDFQAKPMSKEREVDLMQIIDKFSSITNLAYWAVYFRNGVKQITKDDWKLVTSEFDAAAVK